MPEHPYLPGKALILSRLPPKDWFTLDEAAQYSGWSRSFIVARVRSGELPAQQYQKPLKNRAKGKRTHLTHRIYMDDLVIFIMRNSGGRYTEEKPFRDVVSIIRTWPAWMIRELLKALNRILPQTGAGQATNPTSGKSEGR
jgi:hypothetical protein